MSTELLAEKIIAYLYQAYESPLLQDGAGYVSYAILEEVVSHPSEFAMNNALRYLKGEGYIEDDVLRYRITARGRDYFTSRSAKRQERRGDFLSNTTANILGGVIAGLIVNLVLGGGLASWWGQRVAPRPMNTSVPFNQNTLMFGPTNGNLIHRTDGRFDLKQAGVKVRDFIAEVKFYNRRY